MYMRAESAQMPMMMLMNVDEGDEHDDGPREY